MPLIRARARRDRTSEPITLPGLEIRNPGRVEISNNAEVNCFEVTLTSEVTHLDEVTHFSMILPENTD